MLGELQNLQRLQIIEKEARMSKACVLFKCNNNDTRVEKHIKKFQNLPTVFIFEVSILV